MMGPFEKEQIEHLERLLVFYIGVNELYKNKDTKHILKQHLKDYKKLLKVNTNDR